MYKSYPKVLSFNGFVIGRIVSVLQVRHSLLTMMVTTFSILDVAHAEYRYVFEQTNYSVAPLSQVDVLVYLQETGTSILKDEGLIGTGVTVRFDDPPLPSSPARVLMDADVAKGPDFEEVWFKSAEPSQGYAALSQGTFGTAYGEETVAGSDTYRVLLGTFTFTTGGIPNETTCIRATDFSEVYDDIIYYRNGTPMSLDNLVQDGTATIATIPEPSALMLLGAVALPFMAFRTAVSARNRCRRLTGLQKRLGGRHMARMMIRSKKQPGAMF